MASVQPAAAAASGGGYPPAAATMPLPPNLTKEQVQATLVKYQQMKANGTREDDPEYIKARNLLQAVQNQTNYAKRQAMLRQQQQQQQQQQQSQLQSQQSQPQPPHSNAQQNGATTQAITNGNHAPAATHPESTPSNSHNVNNNNNATVANGQAQGQLSQAPNSAEKPSTTPSLSFSPDQLHLLRNQISAFKQLSKNLPLPSPIQQQLFASRKRQSTSSDPLAVVNQNIDGGNGSVGSISAAKQDGDSPQQQYHTFSDPYAKLEKRIGYMDHALRDRRPLIPSIMPVGVDVDKYREERENIVYNRIVSRKAELEKLPANIGAWDTSKIDAPQDDGSLKLKALIEYKMLCLLPKQRTLRQQISREIVHADNLAMTANRSMYRRVKRQSIREARITEKLEKQQRDARETKERKKYDDFLQSIITHAQEVRRAAAAQRHRVQKFGRLMLQTHVNIEKEEQKRVERTAKQRLMALKANDVETYMKLLGEAKDDRVSELLKQTGSFLTHLTNSVKQQQRSAMENYGGNVSESSDESEVEEDEDGNGKKVDYYEVAHKIKEDVKQQSSNLVGGTLKDYQLKGLQWMLSLYNNNLNGILADEMGLGKTIQTISLITYLIEKKQQPGPYLVIVPLSTLTNWNNEFEKWAPGVRRILYKGPPAKRKELQQTIRWGNFQVLLTTYEFIIKDRPILSKVKWLHMIVDEGHRMKNANSKLSSTITHYYNTRYRLILTGTPLQNNLPELWALLNFVLPTIFKSVKSFDEWFNTPFANTGGQEKVVLSEEEQLLIIRRLHLVLRPFLLRRLKKDVEKDLPDKQERVIKCNFSALQARLYRQLVNHQKLMVSDGKGGKTGVRGLSNMLMQLRKLCNHPFVFEEVEEQMNPDKGTNDLLWRTAGKFELLDRVLPKFKATGHRVLMFFQMTQIMNIMEDFLRLREMPYLRLDGSTKSDDRSELLKLFNAPGSQYFCFLLSTRAGGLGLNLQTADTVIIYDSDWNPHQDLQAQDRAHRIGQKNEVRILRLISSNSVEEKILERANYKLDMDGKVIQAGKFDNKSTNEERDAMLRVMLDSAESAEALEQEEMDDDDLNELMMRGEDELQVFQKIDEDRIRMDKYGPDKKLPRLLGESELPDIYVNDDEPVVEDNEDSYGRGARERTRVKYDDGLTEEQWLEAVDNDDDTIEAAMARKDARVARRAENKEKRRSGGASLMGSAAGADTPSVSRDSSEEPAPRKRGRKTKVEKRKADEASLDGDAAATPAAAPPAKKRGRRGPTKAADPLPAEERATLQKVLNAVYETLLDLEEESSDAEVPNRGIIDLFVELPDRTDYPDYYMIIKNPICMNQIKKKINRKEYTTLKQFRQDIGLMTQNCRVYNEDGSLLEKDANLIEQTCVKRLKEETEGHPEMQDFEDDGSAAQGKTGTAEATDGAASAAAPSAGGKSPAPASDVGATVSADK